MKKDVCFIIYARLGSERTPRKMLKPFAGTTLIDIALDKIKMCQTIPLKDFYLCVHEPELIELGKRRGFHVFERSEASMREDSHLPTLMEWWDKLPYTYCVAISACHPFLEVSTIDGFINEYVKSPYVGMYPVVARRNYFWSVDRQLITEWPEGEDLLNTKAVSPTYEGANCMWAGRLDTIGNGIWMGTFRQPNDPQLYVIENEREVLDIDYPWQFDMCEAYAKTLRVSNSAWKHASPGDMMIETTVCPAYFEEREKVARQYGHTFSDLDVIVDN